LHGVCLQSIREPEFGIPPRPYPSCLEAQVSMLYSRLLTSRMVQYYRCTCWQWQPTLTSRHRNTSGSFNFNHSGSLKGRNQSCTLLRHVRNWRRSSRVFINLVRIEAGEGLARGSRPAQYPSCFALPETCSICNLKPYKSLRGVCTIIVAYSLGPPLYTLV